MPKPELKRVKIPPPLKRTAEENTNGSTAQSVQPSGLAGERENLAALLRKNVTDRKMATTPETPPDSD